MAGYLSIFGSSWSEAGSRALGPWETRGDVDIDEQLELPLTSGTNAVDVPEGAVAAIVVAAPGGPDLTLKTDLNASDAGLPLAAPTVTQEPLATVLPLAVGVTRLIVGADGAGSCTVVFI